jgi:hypothetical protein
MNCVDDPTDSCDPNNGGADCIGICILTNRDASKDACGGVGGLSCPGISLNLNIDNATVVL